MKIVCAKTCLQNCVCETKKKLQTNTTNAKKCVATKFIQAMQKSVRKNNTQTCCCKNTNQTKINQFNVLGVPPLP